MKQEVDFNKVLITGIDGFTGSYLESLLVKNGYEVYGTVLNNASKNNHLVCDITQKNQIFSVLQKVKPNYIFHLAGISFVGEKDKILTYNVNVIGTENLLESVDDLKLSPKKIIIASSATVYGNQNKTVLNEKMCPKPLNHYAFSKLILEHVASNYFDKFNIIITRPFNYTGIGQNPNFLIPKIVKHYKEGKASIELGNINVSREFNNVKDVVEIYMSLMTCNCKSVIVNVCSNSAISITQILEYLNKKTGISMIVNVNANLVRANEIPVLKGSITLLKSITKNRMKSNIYNLLDEMYDN